MQFTGYTLSDVPLDDITWDDGKAYHPWKGSGASKTANILFTTSACGELLRSKGIGVLALQPGMPQTKLYAGVTEDGPTSMAEGIRLGTERSDGVAYDVESDVKTVEQAAAVPLDAGL